MKNFHLLLTVCLIILFSNVIYSATTTITVSVSKTQVCLGSSDVSVTITATINPAPTNNFAVHWYRNSTEEHTDNRNGSPANTNLILTYTYTYSASNPNYNGTQNFKVTVDDGTVYTSNTFQVNLNYLNVQEKSPSDQVLLYSAGNYDLVANMFDIPNGANYNWSFNYSPGPGVYNSGGKWILNPTYFSSGTVIDSIITYTVSNGGCSIYDTVFNTRLTIINPVMPPFIIPISPLPVCENQGTFYAYVSMKPSCWNSSTLIMNIQGQLVTATLTGSDPYSGNYLYFFSFNPAIRNSNNEINISIITLCPYPSYSGKISVLPAPAPTLNGLPPGTVTNNINFVSLCKASADTISMKSNTSGGTYSYYLYKWDGTNVNYVSAITPANFNYTGFAPDPTTSRFIPYQVYDKHIRPLNDDSYVIMVRYLGPQPCPKDTNIYLRFNSPISATFTQSADTICYGNPVTLTVNYPSISNGDNFSWDFGDGTSLNNDPSTTITHSYDLPGMYRIRFRTNTLEGTTLPNCESDVIDTIWVGATPVSDFAVEKNFLNVKAAFQSKAQIPSNKANLYDPTDIITRWDYIFQPGFSFSLTNPDTVYQYTSLQEDPYQVLHIATTKWGCKDTAVKYIPIFPIHTPTTGQFVMDDFTKSNLDGWFHSGQYKNSDTLSSWQNVTPSPTSQKIITASATGSDVWITSKNTDPDAGYYNNEKSWVESPVYDISNLTLPMVSLNTWTNTDNLFDGASLQYAFCDSIPFGNELWHTLGKKGAGLDWYNSNTVIAKPGNDLNGWTGDTIKNWKLSAYNLEEPLDSINTTRKLIRFRVVLGTNSDNTPGKGFAGFAFDNFFVGERNRKVLVEEFCDYVLKEDGVDTVFKDPQAILLQYHVRSHHTDDIINNQNTAEPSARALLYGVGQSLPRGVIDGILENNTKKLVEWGPNEFFKRSLYVSPFEIKIRATIDGSGKLSITDTIRKIGGTNIIGPFVNQIAVVEMKVNANGQNFPNVLRNLLPNSAGTRIDQNYNWNTNFTNTQSWAPFVKPNSSLMIVAFIQDENTKEIYQSNYITIDSTTAVNLPVVTNRFTWNISQPVSFTEVSLSPNPTSGDINIFFNGILTGTYSWVIIDALGNTLKSGTLSEGISSATINIDGLSNSIYYLKIDGGGQNIIKKFSLIK